MNTRRRLDIEFSKQITGTDTAAIDEYIAIAAGYANIEKTLTVLSDLREKCSYIACGDFASALDLGPGFRPGKINSIWENEIFSLIRPDDLEMKMVQELLFYHHINRLPPRQRFRQCLIQRLRMRDRHGHYIDTLHRLFYIPDTGGCNIRLTLCLYGAMTVQLPAPSYAVDTLTGHTRILDSDDRHPILSPQEINILKLIDGGHRSKEIASMVNISVNTVSRHRQNIIAKLNVRNSVEACRTARLLNLI